MVLRWTVSTEHSVIRQSSSVRLNRSTGGVLHILIMMDPPSRHKSTDVLTRAAVAPIKRKTQSLPIARPGIRFASAQGWQTPPIRPCHWDSVRSA